MWSQWAKDKIQSANTALGEVANAVAPKDFDDDDDDDEYYENDDEYEDDDDDDDDDDDNNNKQHRIGS